MKWKPPQEYFVESQCGHYRISKAYVRNNPVYTPWILTGRADKNGNWWSKRSLGVCESAEEAKGLIEDSL